MVSLATPQPTSTELPAELTQAVEGFFNRIPFNRLLGIEIDTLRSDCVAMSLPMRPDLIGNFTQGILHGGAISSLLDVCGGAMALIGAFERHAHLSVQERMIRLAKLGTIDLRVDYLRPGRGEHFICTSSLLRSGNKVGVVRSELHSNDGTLIAVGTGTYLCG
ncbi:MAG TPA: thioesterase family protein [Pseudomonas sabulinigri]|uniref:Thioesterase domain-containing protein n=1 Tax=marine sediment metagenome TaxID=412755 RepID=A0A0F9T304_9ZZZZ|nr:thioesterase family protein [Halopseudomonas sabulinigri]HEC53401.1 thioesterase family protein [Halopseudomonas sabulinigri]|tara:strand:+ start:9625 stop:10113 length:489 start_codon:yes stop_codon:yes gene_type:complete